MTPSIGIRIDPPDNIMAIAIDAVSEKGKIRIFRERSGEQLDGVGIEWAGHKVMVPWDNTWWLRASGETKIEASRKIISRQQDSTGRLNTRVLESVKTS
ncbi:hypothetical protein N7519_002083 [Penicillium mononematosum]|uniref:uncharacterized protein n=1 Tax=Penicillium mononematosum TaxID=268346 RepID=UPI0025469267|nr:uncharacterized protein N7519_002083 [Penicillium mononematosum]KAJ6187175.1 hypothetical protein N7519_002083 [Penicillium mononematosum]